MRSQKLVLNDLIFIRENAMPIGINGGSEIADNYVYFLLENMMDVLDDLIIIFNGILDIMARILFQKYTNQIYVRDNMALMERHTER